MNSIFTDCRHSIITWSACLIFWAIFIPAQASMTPGWDDVPEPLTKTAGIQLRDGWTYVTAVAPVMVSDSGKIREFARKKSWHRAVQYLRMALSCGDLAVSVPDNQQNVFLESYAPVAPDMSVRGVTTIRQWERDNNFYTTIAAPINPALDYSCMYSSIGEIIVAYLGQDDISLNGLIFSLSQVSRYSSLREKIRYRIGNWYMAHDFRVLARPFMKGDTTQKTVSEIDLLQFQNHLDRARKITAEAKKMAAKGQWQEALENVSDVLDLVPTYSAAYLVIADYFLQKAQQPQLALFAAETAMRDGTHFDEALRVIVACLQMLKSDEIEIFRYLQDLVSKSSRNLPEPWNGELKLVEKVLIPSLVIRSGGHAIYGENQLADQRFNEAVKIFGKAESEDQILMVLAQLMSASEMQPLSAETYNLIGACYRYLNKPEIALPFLWQALQLKHDYDLALTNLGLCCRNLGLLKAAGYYFKQDAVKKSDNSWVQKSYREFLQSEAGS